MGKEEKIHESRVMYGVIRGFSVALFSYGLIICLTVFSLEIIGVHV